MSDVPIRNYLPIVNQAQNLNFRNPSELAASEIAGATLGFAPNAANQARPAASASSQPAAPTLPAHDAATAARAAPSAPASYHVDESGPHAQVGLFFNF